MARGDYFKKIFMPRFVALLEVEKFMLKNFSQNFWL